MDDVKVKLFFLHLVCVSFLLVQSLADLELLIGSSLQEKVLKRYYLCLGSFNNRVKS